MLAASKSISNLNSADCLKVCRSVYPEKNIKSIIKQFLFFIKLKKNSALIDDFQRKINHLSYSHILGHEPSVLGNLVWPYLHKNWEVEERFDRIAAHYSILKSLPSYLDVSDRKSKQIVDLSTYSAGTCLVLDKPQWFIREGEIVLNLFRNELRVMSIAFLLNKYQNETVMYVGAIQGIHNGVDSEKSLEIIRQLTKDFHGLRPRSLTIEVLKMIATHIGVRKILAVNQANRHHKHKYFKSAWCLKHSNYDEIWQDHGGLDNGGGFYLLSVDIKHKDLSEIESKKRSQHRKRYAMLDDIAEKIAQLT